ncbi:MAG: FG-GAP-like repeat-containing protein [Ignavibacteriaceae bacterium]
MFIQVRLKLIISIIACLLIFSFQNFSQNFQRVINSPQVIGFSGSYNNPFSGGFNNIEHQFIDIDGDGDFDLFYRNSDGTFGWFENTGNKFNPDFNLSIDTIPGLTISDWFYFIDIDDDGDFDLFTGNGEYVSFLRNAGSPEQAFFITAQDTLKDINGNPIVSEFGSNPVFVDIDHDGDYDFILGNSAGTVTFYENVGNETNFSFKFITNSWQNILIIGGILDDPLHGSSSLDFADIDSDGDKDLFWGDFFSKSLYFIENQGNPSNPSMQLVSTVYPVNADSIFTSGYNMPRLIDIDGDGDLDLFVSVLYDPSVSQSLMFFRNVGSLQQSDHVHITDDYLYTLDVGNNSHPVFVDIDSDGDLDLFIGSFNNPLGSLHYFNNQGSSTSPLFNHIDSVFAGIQYDLSVVPAFGDLDGDSDYDLLVGKLDGRISYYKNEGTRFSPVFSYIGDLTDINQNIINVGNFASPFLFDIDNDGDLDLIVGSFNGRFQLYLNKGNSANYSFELNENYFSGLDVGDNSTPVLFDFTGDGRMELFSGSRQGDIFLYTNSGTVEFPDWVLETNKFLNQNFGGYSVPCFVDIDNDSDTDLIFGNVKGGLYFYNNLSVSNVSDKEIRPDHFNMIESFPNPFNPKTNIIVNIESSGNTSVKIFNLLGEKVKDIYYGHLDAGKHRFGWDGTNDSYVSLPAGHYFILLNTDETYYTAKITYVK